MCGICGIYNFNKNDLVEKSVVTQMCDLLRHRGPDDEGYHLDKNVGLGHRRLSVIDIEGGHQPMSNEDGTIWIVQNGEIYNYLELTKKLKSIGHRFKTKSDTEAILHLYEEFGTGCLDRLNGMFAFAIWDSIKRRLFLARDRLGIKPLYFYVDNERFVFASETKAILKMTKIEREVDYKALNEYFTFQYCLGEKTLFRRIRKLLPGHKLVIANQKMKIRKYWDLNFSVDFGHREKDIVERLKRLIEDSIRLRLRSDVPVGAHLSGGIDSSTIVCTASTLLRARLKTFTGAFKEGEDFNETRYARIVSKYCNTLRYEILLKPSDFIKSFSKLIYFLDEPVAGPGIFPQYFVSKLASQKVKVILGGQGGDEVFGGYTRYLIAYLEECIRAAIFESEGRGNFVATLKSIIPNLPQLKRYEALLQYFWQDGLFSGMDERYYRLIRKDVEMKDLICKGAYEKINHHNPFHTFQEIFNQSNLGSLINRMTNFDIKTLLPALLQVEDRTSMGVSLESRTPLLDHRIVELVAATPPTIKFKNGEAKHLLRQAMRKTIPKEILARKDKVGFAVPLSEWYRGSLKNFVKDILLDGRTKRRKIFNTKNIERQLGSERKYGRTIWGLLCLEMWFRTFIDRS